MDDSKSSHQSNSQEPTLQGTCSQERAPLVGQTLRRARKHFRLSLREVERKIGRSNAYLSQVERGLIKRPDPVVLLELADLYRLNFETLATWAGWHASGEELNEDIEGKDSTRALVRRVLELNDSQRTKALVYIEGLLREAQT